MKFHSSLLMTGMLAASLVCAENLTQSNVERAQSIITGAVQAHGGNERLSAMQTVIVEYDDVTHAVGQSRSASPPWDRNAATGMSAVDLENDIFTTRNSGSGGGFEFDGGTIINGDHSCQLDYRNGTVARITAPDFATTSGPMFRVTPALLVRTLRDRAQNAYFLGEVKADDAEFEVVGFSMQVGPAISLYFDKQSHLLRRSERVIPGVGLVEYRFTDYEMVEGIPFNREFELLLNADTNLERQYRTTSVNAPLGDLIVADASLARIPEVAPDELRRQEIADGVYLIGGSGTYAMFVDMGDYIVASGGTAGIPERLALLREVVPEKPIKYAVMTHHHFDHVVGVSAYEEEGSTLVTAGAHEAVVRRAAKNGDALRVRTVDDRLVLKGDSRSVDIIDIGPTAHSEHLLVTYLANEKLLFEADHFALPQAGPVPPAVSATRTFAAALREHGLDVEKIASAHSPRVATIRELRSAIDRQPPKLSRN